MRGLEQIPWLYDAAQAVSEALGFRRWRLWLVRGAQGRTLEVGCGTGRNLPLYAADVTLVAVDPSPEALAAARKRAPAAMLVRASAEALPFRDASFDCVISSLVFCSVPDPAKGLAEVRRTLKREGALRMVEHVRSTGSFGAWLQDFIQPAWTAVAGGCHPNRDTERNVIQAGFQIDPGSLRIRGNMRRFFARKRQGAES